MKLYTHPITKATITKKEYMEFMFGSKFILAKSKGDLVEYKTIQEQLKSISLF